MRRETCGEDAFILTQRRKVTRPQDAEDEDFFRFEVTGAVVCGVPLGPYRGAAVADGSGGRQRLAHGCARRERADLFVYQGSSLLVADTGAGTATSLESRMAGQPAVVYLKGST